MALTSTTPWDAGPAFRKSRDKGLGAQGLNRTPSGSSPISKRKQQGEENRQPHAERKASREDRDRQEREGKREKISHRCFTEMSLWQDSKTSVPGVRGGPRPSL